MGDEPLTNAAVEVLREGAAYLSALDAPPTRRSGTRTSDELTFEDRRSGGLNFGTVDASGWSEFIGTMWGVGSGRPSLSVREVVAVRGQRCAAAVLVIDYGTDMVSPQIHCSRVTPDLTRLERVILFDVDDRDAAIAELDRLHAEIDD